MLLIFDFDGVVADSERLACAVAARYATDLGAPMSGAEGLALFLGKRARDVRDIIAQRGGTVSDDFERQLLERTLDAFSHELSPVAGVEQFLATHADIPRCIASSSSHARLDASLSKIGLSAWFAGAVFSADDVKRGKPAPDLFLHAAETLGVSPAECVVIEDSPAGVKAGVAAGMRVIGLLAGSHLGEGHGQVLMDAGAREIANGYLELAALL